MVNATLVFKESTHLPALGVLLMIGDLGPPMTTFDLPWLEVHTVSGEIYKVGSEMLD